MGTLAVVSRVEGAPLMNPLQHHNGAFILGFFSTILANEAWFILDQIYLDPLRTRCSAIRIDQSLYCEFLVASDQ